MNVLPWQKELIDYLLNKYDDEKIIKEYLLKLEKQTGKNILLETNYYYLCIRNKKLKQIYERSRR